MTRMTKQQLSEAITPTLDAFTAEVDLVIARATAGIYDCFMHDVQDYLRGNVEWGIGKEIDRCNYIKRKNRALVEVNADLLAALQGAMSILGIAEARAIGTPAWDFIGPLVAAASAAIAKATGEVA
jgi:hypothetical protein